MKILLDSTPGIIWVFDTTHALQSQHAFKSSHRPSSNSLSPLISSQSFLYRQHIIEAIAFQRMSNDLQSVYQELKLFPTWNYMAGQHGI